MNKALINAYYFFRERAGGIVGRNAISALQLAKAEQNAAAIGVEFQWVEDDFPELGEHDLWCGKTGCRHETWGCVAWYQGEAYASLWSIIDPTNDYRRVVEAELAEEALSTLRPQIAAVFRL